MIHTKNLFINPWSENQGQEFFELTQDEGFNLYPINVYRQKSTEDAHQWVKDERARFIINKIGKFAVKEISTGKLIGMGGLTPWIWEGENLVDITYRLRESAWGKGYGMELAEALVKYARDQVGLKELTATITPDNLPSKKIAERLGFKFDKRIELNSVPTDLYRLLISA